MQNSKIWLSSPHMGGNERKFVTEAFDTNWVAPLGPNVNGFESRNIDLTARERNELSEQKTDIGIAYFNLIIDKIKTITEQDLSTEITVFDDLGLGTVSSKSTFGAMLMQAQSHAIHHFASVGYIIHQLGIELPDSDFGYNPSTVKK